jgi:hypothetical protein
VVPCALGIQMTTKETVDNKMQPCKYGTVNNYKKEAALYLLDVFAL